MGISETDLIGRQVKRLLRDEEGSTLPIPITGIIEMRLSSPKTGAKLWRIKYSQLDVKKYNLTECEDLTESEVGGLSNLY